jgi:hypothetical protein
MKFGEKFAIELLQDARSSLNDAALFTRYQHYLRNNAIDLFAVAIVLFFLFSDEKYPEKLGFQSLRMIPTFLNFS